MWEQERLFDVIERYLFHRGKCGANNPIISGAAEKICEVEIWEMWALTQYL